MNLINHLFLAVLICNLNSFASLNNLRPLVRKINTKATKSFITHMQSISGDESKKLDHLQKLMQNECIDILKLNDKEHHKLIHDITQAKTYLEKVEICKKSIEELCQQQLIETIEPLSPEIKTLIIEKIGNDYQSMSQKELEEAIKDIQTFQEESIKKSEKILSIILPLGVGIAAIIPTCWYIYIIDLISG